MIRPASGPLVHNLHVFSMSVWWPPTLHPVIEFRDRSNLLTSMRKVTVCPRSSLYADLTVRCGACTVALTLNTLKLSYIALLTEYASFSLSFTSAAECHVISITNTQHASATYQTASARMLASTIRYKGNSLPIVCSEHATVLLPLSGSNPSLAST